ncbi:HPF/RaiA family ribosome-associated protein [Frateuria defendens]|uniref:HPF/RaiA family ribosome-associated protein n=1 Tax=Frateuria defendens TaxID=2219559 RepID=UPI00066FDDBA|nr:HPF/RaiA family ribosome-associated protein [Frateuria defendens]
MTIPTNITFQGVPPSDALCADIHNHVRKLEHVAGDALLCRVVVRMAEHSHRQGNRYSVHARLLLSGHEVEAGLMSESDQQHEDPYIAVANTFEALRRRTEDYVRRRREHLKAYENRQAGL